MNIFIYYVSILYKVEKFMIINKQENPAMFAVIEKAMSVNCWDYKSTDDFLTYAIDDDLGYAFNRELESSPNDVVDEFYSLMPEWG